MDALSIAQRLTLIIGSALAASFPHAARAQKFTPPPITWCDAAAKKVEWAEQTVYLSLAEGTPFGTGFLKQDAVQDILVAIATQIRAMPSLSSSAVSEKGAMLPSANGVYSPAALLGNVYFQMTPNGKVGHVSFHDVRDSAFAHDLRVALKVINGTTPKDDVDSLVHYHTFVLAPSFTTLAPFASFALFRMHAPVAHNIETTKRSRRAVPEGFENWNANLRLSFFVDTAGNIEKETVHSVPAVENFTFPNDEQRQVFMKYVGTATQIFQESQYKPADYLGCRIRQEISYSMMFRALN